MQIYHHFLCPFSKQIAILMSELDIAHIKIEHQFWKPNPEFDQLSTWGERPVMIVEDNVIIGAYPCFEYILAETDNKYLLSSDILILTRIRQVVNWFNKHFYEQVSAHIIHEKLVKMFSTREYIDTSIMRLAHKNLHDHMLKMSAIIDMQGYLAQDDLSYADLVAASHLAVIDYFGDINWSLYPKVKEWYCLIKSRPIFRSHLEGKITGIDPSMNYLKLDF